jgi:prepilin-type N-terminal cleavage/methylation domain-containing protein
LWTRQNDHVNRSPPPGGRRAFTVVELLVVIAVISILAALLFPVLSAVKSRARRTVCMNNLRQLNLGLRMYCDDSSDTSPQTGHARFGTAAWSGYRKLTGNYVGLNGGPSPQDRLFACPADTFFLNLTKIGAFVYNASTVHSNLYAQPLFDFSSYGFNGGTAPRSFGFGPSPGIGGQKLSSVREPSKTLLLLEAPAFFPYSWHEPSSPPGLLFNDAKNMLSYVDGHVNFTKIYWNPETTNGVHSLAMRYDPPAGYDYKWSGD